MSVPLTWLALFALSLSAQQRQASPAGSWAAALSHSGVGGECADRTAGVLGVGCHCCHQPGHGSRNIHVH